jgi:hypothetical protein
MEAVRELRPRLQFGFTATPIANDETNILYSYGLAECLREGQYTKAVKIWVEQAPDGVGDDDWDHVILDFGLQRLQKKRAAIMLYSEEHPDFPFIEPVMLVAARDTEHADNIAQWLKEKREFRDEEIHVAHSQRRPSEAELSKLVSIDKPGNQIRVVINVFQLSEGWDVTNVYVIAPLRAMATYQNAVQSMGRGLRLPAGRRLEQDELDTLDVLCFGRESFENIISQATQQFGKGPDGSAAISLNVRSDDADNVSATKPVTIEAKRNVKFEIPKIRRVQAEPELNFSTSKAPTIQVITGIDIISLDRVSAEDDQLNYRLSTVVRLAVSRVISDLPYLSSALHYKAVEKLTRELLERLGAKDDEDIAVDPLKVAILVSEEIDRRYKSQPVKFEFDGNTETTEPQSFEWRVPEDFVAPLNKSAVTDWR